MGQTYVKTKGAARSEARRLETGGIEVTFTGKSRGSKRQVLCMETADDVDTMLKSLGGLMAQEKASGDARD